MFGLATAQQDGVQRGPATAKFGIAKVAKRFGQQRQSFVVSSKGIGIGLFSHAAYGNAKVKL